MDFREVFRLLTTKTWPLGIAETTEEDLWRKYWIISGKTEWSKEETGS